MPIQVTWGNTEKTYTCFKYIGKWTWEEYYQSIEDGYQLIKDIPGTINILLDMTECSLFPANMLSRLGSSMRRPPRAFDLAIVVTTSGFVHAITGVLNSLYGKRSKFKVTRTVEEAHFLLAEHDKQQQMVSRV